MRNIRACAVLLEKGCIISLVSKPLNGRYRLNQIDFLTALRSLHRILLYLHSSSKISTTPGDLSVSPEVHSRPLMLQLQNNPYSVDTLLAKVGPNETPFQFGCIPCIELIHTCFRANARVGTVAILCFSRRHVKCWNGSIHFLPEVCIGDPSIVGLKPQSATCSPQFYSSFEDCKKLQGLQGPQEDAKVSKLAALLDRTSSQTAQSVRFHPGISELRS